MFDKSEAHGGWNKGLQLQTRDFTQSWKAMSMMNVWKVGPSKHPLGRAHRKQGHDVCIWCLLCMCEAGSQWKRDAEEERHMHIYMTDNKMMGDDEQKTSGNPCHEASSLTV